jgi:hypothetical protein
MPASREQAEEVLRAVAPLLVLGIVLQLLVVRADLMLFLQFIAGSGLAALGMYLMFVGIDMGVLPMGRYIGAELPKKGSLLLILGVAFALGFATTSAEPDVLVLVNQVESVSDGALPGRLLLVVVAGGVGVFSALALLRVVYGFSMARLLMTVYSVVILLSLLAPSRFVPLAYDAGSVTTGLLTTPVILALALGFTSVFGGRSAVDDGFGLLGLASVGPILTVLLLGLLS